MSGKGTATQVQEKRGLSGKGKSEIFTRLADEGGPIFIDRNNIPFVTEGECGFLTPGQELDPAWLVWGSWLLGTKWSWMGNYGF